MGDDTRDAHPLAATSLSQVRHPQDTQSSQLRSEKREPPASGTTSTLPRQSTVRCNGRCANLSSRHKMKARDDGISGRFGKRYRGDAESAKAAIQRVGHAVSKVDDSHCGSHPCFRSVCPLSGERVKKTADAIRFR